ncbi:MAG: Acetylglutamate kinase [Candidatus Latescibacteria bacterium ADurb.Bin168]|nr:MAG: Acetylglutamate kinase [Candidatus Latescibacteria bacterium ADurb.Bin168]
MLALIKIGGSTLDSPGLIGELASDLARLGAGRTILVHGGGKDINRALDRLGQPTMFVDGLRVTDAAAVETVEAVLSAQVNKRLVRALLAAGARAVGISGVDGALLRARPYGDGRLGFVGAIEKVDPAVLVAVLNAGFLPVVSPISVGGDGLAYNVNADHAAAEIAMAMKVDDLVFVTDVPGVLVGGGTLPLLTGADAEKLIANGQITGGMIPKVRSCVEAVRRGVGRVHILSWDGAATISEHLAGVRSHGTVIRD